MGNKCFNNNVIKIIFSSQSKSDWFAKKKSENHPKLLAFDRCNIRTENIYMLWVYNAFICTHVFTHVFHNTL